MTFQLTGPVKAKEIFELRVGQAPIGLPSFANLSAKPIGKWSKKPEQLRGPGVYGLSCKGSLVYVGIYAGNAKKTFNGSVLDRWQKHLTFFAMRTPGLSFAPGNLQRILSELTGPAIDEIAGIFGKSTFANGELEASGHPLIKGRSCTFNKARFAVKNWDIFAPGHEDAMLEEMSFVYARFLPGNPEMTGEMGDSAQAKAWAFSQWLSPREGALIDRFKPICNAGSGAFRKDVTEEQFTLALMAEMNSPIPRFVPAIAQKAA